MNELETIRNEWDHIIEHTRTSNDLLETSVNVWLVPLRPYAFHHGELILTTPEEGFINLIKKKYSLLLKVAIEELTGIKTELTLVSKEHAEDLDNNHKPKILEKKYSFQDLLKKANINPNYTFDTFVVGNSNSLAHAASLAVAELPGETYNPLYIYGGAGLGKTHLMHSIANFILREDTNRKVRYVTSETFINEFVDSIRNKNYLSPQNFRNRYRELDVLLIDDIQFLIGKEGTQEEFFHTFNTLYEGKKQIVIASDKPPKDIDNLEERLRSRFEMGLLADIQMPDYETRMAILRKKEELEGYDIDNEIMQYIATNIKSNIRELEGALNKIVAMSRLEKKKVTLELAEDLLKDHISSDRPREITAQFIIATVAEHYGLSIADLSSQRKKKEIVVPRQIAMYLCREMTDVPLKVVGDLLGGRDHTTIMHGYEKISTELTTNEQLSSTIDTLKKKISP